MTSDERIKAMRAEAARLRAYARELRTIRRDVERIGAEARAAAKRTVH